MLQAAAAVTTPAKPVAHVRVAAHTQQKVRTQKRILYILLSPVH